MLMKKIIFGAALLIFAPDCFSQQIIDLEENSPYSYNGLEYGFYITNERSREVKGDDYDRYEVNLFVTVR